MELTTSLSHSRLLFIVTHLLSSSRSSQLPYIVSLLLLPGPPSSHCQSLSPTGCWCCCVLLNVLVPFPIGIVVEYFAPGDLKLWDNYWKLALSGKFSAYFMFLFHTMNCHVHVMINFFLQRSTFKSSRRIQYSQYRMRTVMHCLGMQCMFLRNIFFRISWNTTAIFVTLHM